MPKGHLVVPTQALVRPLHEPRAGVGEGLPRQARPLEGLPVDAAVEDRERAARAARTGTGYVTDI